MKSVVWVKMALFTKSVEVCFSGLLLQVTVLPLSFQLTGILDHLHTPCPLYGSLKPWIKSIRSYLVVSVLK